MSDFENWISSLAVFFITPDLYKYDSMQVLKDETATFNEYAVSVFVELSSFFKEFFFIN